MMLLTFDVGLPGAPEPRTVRSGAVMTTWAPGEMPDWPLAVVKAQPVPLLATSPASSIRS